MLFQNSLIYFPAWLRSCVCLHLFLMNGWCCLQMFSTILGTLKSTRWLSSNGTQEGETQARDTQAPAEGLVLWKFTKSASDYKDSSLRRKEKKKKAKEKQHTFTSKNSCLIEGRKSSLAALIPSLRETTWKEKRKQGSKHGLLLRASLRVFIGCSKLIPRVWRVQWGLISFCLDGQAVHSGPHFFPSEAAGLKPPWPLLSSSFRNKLGFLKIFSWLCFVYLW